MPFLNRSLIVYNGSDSLPANDYTDATDWEQTELASMANNGEASAGSWLVRDELGLNPDYKVPTYLSSHSVVIVTVGSNTLFRGRIAAKDFFRGRQKADRAREISLTLEDQNSHLRGMVVHNWVRGAETDAARVQGLAASYLSGSPRVTTNLNGSNYVITGSNAIAVPAKTYSGVTPFEILTELALETNKQFFVTIDNELAYIGNDYAGYTSQLRISDNLADANATTFAPIDPRSSLIGRDVLTALRIYYGSDVIQQSYGISYPGTASFFDNWEEAIWDSTSVTAAQAAARAANEIAYRGTEDAEYSCTIGPMTGDDIYKIKAGQTIQFKARAARGARLANGTYSGDSFTTLRIAEIRWTMPAPDIYFAHLSFDNRHRGRSNQALATQPKPAPVISTTTNVLAHWTFNDPTLYGAGPEYGAHDVETGTLGFGSSAVYGHYGPADAAFGCTGSPPNGYGWARTGHTDEIPGIVVGTTYTMEMDILWELDPGARIPAWQWTNGSGGTVGSAIPLGVMPYSTDTKYHLSAALVAPGGSAGGWFVWSAAAFTYVDNLSLSGPGSGTTDPYALPSVPGGGTSPYYARSDDPRFTDPDLTITRHLVNNSGLAIDRGDVVIQDTTRDDAFTVNTTTAYSSGWIGVAQQPIGSNTVGNVLLSGYTPVINVGSNSTTRGFRLYGSNMARRAYGSNARATGAFGQVLTTSVAPDAIIWSTSDGAGGTAGGSSLTDHDHTTAGDGGDLTGALISNFIDTTEQGSAPASPAAGKVRLFGSNLNLYQKDSGGVVTRLSGSGGSSGGASWSQVVSESGTSFANWTARVGTWDSDGTVIRHTSVAAAWHYADFTNTTLALGSPVIAEAECKLPSAGQGTGSFVESGIRVGAIGVLLRYSGTQAILHQDFSVTDYNDVAFTIALDTWYKVRCVVSGSTVTTYIDNVLKATSRIGGTGAANYFGLGGFNSIMHYRNIKLWVLTQP